MNSMKYYPNCKKQSVFASFDVGKHPSELVKEFKTLKYRTLMVYYEEYKAKTRGKNEVIERFEKESIRQLKEEGEEMKARETFEPFVKDFYPSAHAYLKNQPISWFAGKSFMQILDILTLSPWRDKI